MDLRHEFVVPTSIEETWAHFNDIAAVAECFPGAQVSSADAESFAGSVKVKLGPIALQYNGTGTFVEKDDAAHRFVVDAKGKDRRGNGTAGAQVTLTMTEAAGGTDVVVVTDLTITGKPAQFGRGVMQDVSNKLLDQFVACLESRLTTDEPAPTPAAAPAPSAAETPVSVDPLAETPAAEVPVAEAPVAEVPVAEASASTEQEAFKTDEPEVFKSDEPTPVHFANVHPQHQEEIDLGATVLPVVAKAYWKQALGAVLALGLVGWLVKRKRCCRS